MVPEYLVTGDRRGVGVCLSGAIENTRESKRSIKLNDSIVTVRFVVRSNHVFLTKYLKFQLTIDSVQTDRRVRTGVSIWIQTVRVLCLDGYRAEGSVRHETIVEDHLGFHV